MEFPPPKPVRYRDRDLPPPTVERLTDFFAQDNESEGGNQVPGGPEPTPLTTKGALLRPQGTIFANLPFIFAPVAPMPLLYLEDQINDDPEEYKLKIRQLEFIPGPSPQARHLPASWKENYCISPERQCFLQATNHKLANTFTQFEQLSDLLMPTCVPTNQDHVPIAYILQYYKIELTEENRMRMLNRESCFSLLERCILEIDGIDGIIDGHKRSGHMLKSFGNCLLELARKPTHSIYLNTCLSIWDTALSCTLAEVPMMSKSRNPNIRRAVFIRDIFLRIIRRFTAQKYAAIDQNDQESADSYQQKIDFTSDAVNRITNHLKENIYLEYNDMQTGTAYVRTGAGPIIAVRCACTTNVFSFKSIPALHNNFSVRPFILTGFPTDPLCSTLSQCLTIEDVMEVLGPNLDGGEWLDAPKASLVFPVPLDLRGQLENSRDLKDFRRKYLYNTIGRLLDPVPYPINDRDGYVEVIDPEVDDGEYDLADVLPVKVVNIGDNFVRMKFDELIQLQQHPEKHPDKEAVSKMKEKLSEAYNTNEETKSVYCFEAKSRFVRFQNKINEIHGPDLDPDATREMERRQNQFFRFYDTQPQSYNRYIDLIERAVDQGKNPHRHFGREVGENITLSEEERANLHLVDDLLDTSDPKGLDEYLDWLDEQDRNASESDSSLPLPFELEI